jgi:4'-phosphopantetheinyl transferase
MNERKHYQLPEVWRFYHLVKGSNQKTTTSSPQCFRKWPIERDGQDNLPFFVMPTTGSPKLRGDEVHVWRVHLDHNATFVRKLQQILSADERIKAERFYFEKDHRRFIVARGLLRLVLSNYMGIEPSKLRFCYSPYGKPSLAATRDEDAVNFNVSHSRGLALYAVTRGRQLGIDLERIHAGFACEQIAERFFSPRENAALQELPPGEVKEKAFFDCWTRKEAYIKAQGEGLSLPLDQFDVSLAPGEPAKLLDNRMDPKEVSRWSLQEIIPHPAFAATLAVEGHGWRLACWENPDFVSDFSPYVWPVGSQNPFLLQRTARASSFLHIGRLGLQPDPSRQGLATRS